MLLSASTVGAFWLLLPSIKCSCALSEPVLELPARWVQPFPEHLIPVTAVWLSRRGAGAANGAVPRLLREHEARSEQCGWPCPQCSWGICVDELRSIGTTCRGSRVGGGGVGKWPSACPRAQVPTCLVERHQWKKITLLNESFQLQ